MLQKLSPQQIQLMKLLQSPYTASLEQRIKEELEVNPALEEGDSEVDDYYEDEGEEFSSADELDESDKMEDSKEDDVDIAQVFYQRIMIMTIVQIIMMIIMRRKRIRCRWQFKISFMIFWMNN
ncbi:MAG: hypothetical protein IPH74_15745 [Bacteroidetes bacterium]|nr:hypothetical protein [Bacteroidota bacterium]